jgi:iron(III) transport system permease protein
MSTTLQRPPAVAPTTASRGTMLRRLRRRGGAIALVSALALVLWGYVVAPMVATVRTSLTGEDGSSLAEYSRFFSGGATTRALFGSIGISVASVVTSALLGTALAILFARSEFPMKRLCQVLVLVPIALPPLMGVEAFVLLYGEGGAVPQALAQLLGGAQTAFAVKGVGGVLLVHTLTMYPYFYLSVAASLGSADDSLEEAALSLGASRTTTWRRVLLPMLTPAVVAGALLTFMSSMASYTAPLLFDYDNVLTRQIVLAQVNNERQFAATISTVLALVSIAFLIAMRFWEQRRVYRSTSKGGGRRLARVTSPFAKAVTTVVALVASLILLSPILMIAVMAFAEDGSWTTTILPASYTWEHVTTLFTDANAWTPVVTSLQMSAIAVGGAVLLGVLSAYALTRYQFRTRWLLDIAVMLPWALPATVVAINLITAFAGPNPFALGQVLVGTFAIVPLAYFVRFSPLVFRSTGASLAQLDPSIEDAARSLGASWLYAFRRIVLPLLAKGIFAGALLAFVDGVGEFVASILLYTPSSRPLSIAINDALYQAHFGTASVYGLIQVALVIGALAFSQRLGGRVGSRTVSMI